MQFVVLVKDTYIVNRMSIAIHTLSMKVGDIIEPKIPGIISIERIE